MLCQMGNLGNQLNIGWKRGSDGQIKQLLFLNLAKGVAMVPLGKFFFDFFLHRGPHVKSNVLVPDGGAMRFILLAVLALAVPVAAQQTAPDTKSVVLSGTTSKVHIA